MAKKVASKKKKSSRKKVVSKSKAEKEKKIPKDSHHHDENAQIIWLTLAIIFAFAAFLIPYFLIEGQKRFEFAGIEWKIEEYQQFTIYHGMFQKLNGDADYNIFLRNDPRENNIEVQGKLDNIQKDIIISFETTVDEECRGGDVSRGVFDLSSFLGGGVGARNIGTATTDWNLSQNSDKIFVNCDTNFDGTIILLEKGPEAWIAQSGKNPSCYIIKISDCDDVRPLEKFIVRTFEDLSVKE